MLTILTLTVSMAASIHIPGQTNTLLICSGFGDKTITINDQGQEIPAPAPRTNKHCQLCLGAHTDIALTHINDPRSLPDLSTKSKITAHLRIAPYHTQPRKTNPARAPPNFS